MVSPIDLAFAILKEDEEPDHQEHSREEHLNWCKERALALLPDVGQALNSMASDVTKHPETEGLAQHIMTFAAIGFGNAVDYLGRDKQTQPPNEEESRKYITDIDLYIQGMSYHGLGTYSDSSMWLGD